MTDQPTSAERDASMRAAIAELARLTGKTVAEIEAMSMAEMMDRTGRVALHTLAMEAVHAHLDHLVDGGPAEQIERATAALHRFHERVPLYPVNDRLLDLAGFGSAPLRFATFDDDSGLATDQYLLLSEVADALGVPLATAHEWARQDHLDAIATQREVDEQRGDGRLGWECMSGLVDLELSLAVDDPEAGPDADGKRWSCAGDWLISADRIGAFLLASPWREEFLTNARGLLAHAFVKSGLADTLGEVPTYRQPPWDGPMESDGFTLGDHFRRVAEQIPEDDAIERARRGPTVPGTEEA